MNDVERLARAAGDAVGPLAKASGETRNAALIRMADGLVQAVPSLLSANLADVEAGRSAGLSPPFIRIKMTQLMMILPAYNDKHGITSQFNLNLLNRINKELGGDFKTENFYHHAEYDEIEGEARSYIVSKIKQEVNFVL